MIKVTLPEIGEGIESGDVLEVLVREGDVIKKDQDLIELETDKATTGVPSSHAGKIIKIHVREGETVSVGGTLVTLEQEDAQPATRRPPHDLDSDSKSKTEKQSKPSEKPKQPASATAPVKKPEQVDSSPKATAKKTRPPKKNAGKKKTAEAVEPSSSEVAAGPSIRRFAREVGVDLTRVTGTGVGGRITREDVLGVVRKAGTTQAAQGDAAQRDDWGPIHVERVSKIRKTIASKMHESWATVPRVTNFDDADVTELEEFRQDSKADYASKGIKLTTLPFVVKAVAMALKSHPEINSTIDLENDQVIYKDYVNIGIAVDTDRGLVVPSLRQADELSISEIAKELAELAEKVRNRDFSLDDLRGGTFTISNLGAIGGTYSTPIINVPEVAILLVGRSRKMPVVIDDQVAIRLMMPLSVSYDHRLVDGAMAARFLNELIGYLKAPSRLLLAP